MRTGLTMVVLVALLAGCGGGSDEASAPEPETTTATPEANTLAETCPEIEAELPAGAVPNASEWRTYWSNLGEMAEAGDTETQNAIEVLRPAVDQLAMAPSGEDLIDARGSLNSALSAVADRCSAVGSSALQ